MIDAISSFISPFQVYIKEIIIAIMGFIIYVLNYKAKKYKNEKKDLEMEIEIKDKIHKKNLKNKELENEIQKRKNNLNKEIKEIKDNVNHQLKIKEKDNNDNSDGVYTIRV